MNMYSSLILFSFFLHILSQPIINLSDYPYPTPLNSSDFERIAILGTNDIHGHILPEITELSPNQLIRTGGLTFLSSYIKILKEEWKEKLLWLDAGDQYQGTMESNLFTGEPVVRTFNYLNMTNHIDSAIGNHDFDFGRKNMSNEFNIANFSYLAANIYNRSTDKFWNFPNAKEGDILNIGKLKVGIIGLSTVTTPETTATDVSDLVFKDYVNITIKKSKEFKDLGCDIILLTCHVGVFCENGDINDALNLTLRNKNTDQKTNCSETDELYKFLQKLPKNTLDGVIGGHLHTIVHHWNNEIPVMLGDCNARHFNVLYLTYDLKNKKLLQNESLIEGPVPVCETLIENTRSCYINTPYLNHTNVYNFSFHNTILQEDLSLKEILNPFIEKADKYKHIVLGYIENKMEISSNEESALGDFISDSVYNATKADFAIINWGMLRTNWAVGNLTYYNLYETLPFDDNIATFEATGKELIQILDILQSGSMAFYPTTGFKQFVSINPKKLLSVQLIDGSEIIEDKTYVIGANNFLIKGGDDFSKVLKVFTPRNIKVFYSIRDTIAEFIKNIGILNTNNNPIIKPESPRIIITNILKMKIKKWLDAKNKKKMHLKKIK